MLVMLLLPRPVMKSVAVKPPPAFGVRRMILPQTKSA
jgi:hypothetical protein